ncbi:MAG: gliding motility-associated C-terminal domain-containing protein [Saprospiraceae bacterium]
MKIIFTPLFCLALSVAACSQITFKLTLMADNATIKVSMIPAATYTFPQNVTSSGQVTVKVTHGFGDNSFDLINLTNLTPGVTWSFNNRVNSPVEAPSWDYLSFGLSTFGTTAYNYQAGVEIPLFSFQNGAAACADSIELFDNYNDPFLPPNSAGVNVENSLVVIGGGLVNSYSGNFGTGRVPCSPGTTCEDLDYSLVKLCDGEPYQGIIYGQDTTLDEHYTTYLGCDSGYVVDIRVGITTFGMVDTALCAGEIFNGTPINQDETFEILLTNSRGCDSILTIQVQALQATSSESDTLILPGQIFFGTAVFNDTTVVFTHTGSNGCDSFHTVHVGVYQVPVTIQDTTFCQGTPFDGTIYLQSTTLIDTLTGSSGFDSLLLTNLFVNPVYTSFQTVPLCQGGMYKGVTYTSDAVLVEQYLTVHGCDSTIYTTIKVETPTVFTLDTLVCYGEKYQGFTVVKDTLLTTIVPSSHGCDSLVYHANIQVLPAAQAGIQGKTAICHGEPVNLTAYGGASYRWSTGESTKSIEVGAGDSYTVTVTNNFGCQDEASLTVADSNPFAEVSTTAPGCANGSDGTIDFLNPTGGEPPYSFSIDGGQLFTTHNHYNNLLPGPYETRVKDKNGCIWEHLVELADPFDYQLRLVPDTTLLLSQSLRMKVFTNLTQPASIEWWPAAGLDCTDCLEPLATPFESTVYHLRLTDSTGCELEGRVEVNVDRAEQVYVPTAFSPNEDGINEILMVYTGENVSVVRRFEVYDRWGAQLFAAENFRAGDPFKGWDGYWHGKKVPSGAYVWMAQVEYVDGKSGLFQGSVVLLR